MINLIDVHVLHLSNENKHWKYLCDESLKNNPINIFHCNGILGDIVNSRYNGFMQGTAPYVSFVDPDDIVLPGAFTKCLEVLEEYPDVCGVYTLSQIIDIHGNPKKLIHPFREWSKELMKKNINTEIHQLMVMKRKDLIDAFNMILNSNPSGRYLLGFLIALMAKQSSWKAIDFVGYQWRVHPDAYHYTPPVNNSNNIKNQIIAIYD